MFVKTITSDGMLFEWDPAKAAANLRKHGVAFEDAVRVFAIPLKIPMSSGSRMASVGGRRSAQWMAFA
jgi:uncharacterized DUF497 family protein